MADFAFLALCALLIEAAVGYPDWLWKRIGHPVSWVGRIIGITDRGINKPGLAPNRLRMRGAAALVGLLLLVAFVTTTIADVLGGNLPGFFALALLSSSLFAQRSLHAHVAAVARALASSLDEGRAAVAQIVGRDVAALDEAGVARAAIESLAENFSDGVVAPALWTAVAGLPGGALYKAINTADSMIGHRSSRYEDYGKAAARLDDFVNWPAARLGGGLLVAAAVIGRGASARAAWATMLRDARGHRSPNAGWPEAAMAGALGFALGGRRSYGGTDVVDATMGDGRRDLGPADIHAALRLYRRATVLLWVMLALATALLV